MNAKTPALITVLLLTMTGLAFAAESATETFQKGLFEEEGNHDLAAAIQAYQTVISQFDEQRKTAANAIFRLGECYRKQGKTNEANAEYERVLREFSEQVPLAKLSREHLSAQPGESVNETALSAIQLEEVREIEWLKILVKDSPDLVNAVLSPAQGGSGMAPLSKAVRSGQLEVAKFLLAHNAEVNPAGRTPLHEAAMNGHKTMAELLLAHGAKVNGKEQQGATPLHYAANNGFASVTQVLLAHGADVNAKGFCPDSGQQYDSQQVQVMADSTPLHYAAQKGSKAMVELLLGNGADVNAQNRRGLTPLHLALQANQPVVVKALLDHKASVNIKDDYDNTPLHTAVWGNLEGAQLLLEHQADPNAETTSLPNSPSRIPLKDAVEREDKPMVELLLTHGANPSQKVAGTTPLHIAIGKGNIAIAELLLSHKADVNAKADDLEGTTPLHQSIRNGRKDLATLLLSNKADPNAKDLKGNTPLHYAVRTGGKDMVELLLANKAEINTMNNEHENPLDLTAQSRALKNRDVSLMSKPDEIAEFLKKNGAKSARNFVSLSGRVNCSASAWDGNDGMALTQVLGSVFMPDGDLRNVKLIRLNSKTGQAEETTVDVEAINEAIKQGDRSKDVLLKDGDQVVVPAKP